MAAWVSKVAEQRPLTLPWPSELDGTQRGGEALRVGFPGGRKGLSKCQHVRSLQQSRELGWEEGEWGDSSQLKVPPSLLPEKDLYWVSVRGVGASI